jgi:proton glutamate symport protein
VTIKAPGLATRILIGLVAGALIGALTPDIAVKAAPVGEAFIRLIKLIVVPILIATITVGIADAGDLKRVGTLGFKTLLYFEVVTTIALAIGIGAAHLLQPGAGLDPATLAHADISRHVARGQESHNLLLSAIPANAFDAAARGDLLQVLVFSVLMGLATAAAGAAGKPWLETMRALGQVMFRFTHLVMALAPFGVAALVANTVATFGLGVLLPLGKLVLGLYLTMAVFVIVVLGSIARGAGLALWPLIKALKEELILAFSTASSETVLARLMDRLVAAGVPPGIVSFVLPTGYTFNLDGSSLYQGLAVLFIAQVFHLDLSLGQQVVILLTLMVTSKGIAGVPGTSFVVLAATLASTGLPLEGLALIAGVDRLMDMGRTVVNVIGNALATLVIARWEGVPARALVWHASEGSAGEAAKA